MIVVPDRVGLAGCPDKAHFEAAPCALLVTDLDGYCLTANSAFLDIAGWAADEIGAHKFSDVLTVSGKIAYQTHLSPMLVLEGGFQEVALTVRSRSGEDQPVLVSAVLEQPAGGAGIIRFALFKAAQRRLYERELVAMRTAEQTRSSWLRQVEAMADIGAWTIDVATNEISWSEQMFRLVGLPVGAPPTLDEAMAFFPEPSRSEVAVKIKAATETGQPFEFDADLINSVGEHRRVRSTGEPERCNGKIVRFVGILQDITKQHLIEQRLWKDAHIDHLSGIANRSWFQRHLSEVLDRAQRDNEKFSLMILDLDGFKEVNDTLGHQAGDEVIRTTATRIQQAAGPEAFVARLGGDEFAIIVPAPGLGQRVRPTAELILSNVRQPIEHERHSSFVSGSIGVARFPSDATTSESLLRCADMALYNAKRSGGAAVEFFGPALSNIFDARRRAIETVRLAAIDKRIVPFFQPKVRIVDKSIYGFEALARIRHDDGSISGAAEFSPAFSDPESAHQIGEAMLSAVTRISRQWRTEGLNVGTVSLNASEFSFQRGDFAKQVLRLLEEVRLPTSAIEVEITETVFLGEDSRLVQAALEELHEAGVAISLDDFGTGYATLTHLRDFPIDTLKIDRSFVLGLDAQPQNELIIRGIIDLAHNLGIQVVAEGVETQDQYNFLMQARCDAAQGNLFGTPASAEETRLQLRPTGSSERIMAA